MVQKTDREVERFNPGLCRRAKSAIMMVYEEDGVVFVHAAFRPIA
jgi:hypothetical protein